MSRTVAAQCPISTLTFSSENYRSISDRFQEVFVTIGLLGGLYGGMNVYASASIPSTNAPNRCARPPLNIIRLRSYAVRPNYPNAFKYFSADAAMWLRRGKRTRCSAIVLCLTIFGLFASTTTCAIGFILSHQSDFLRSLITSGEAL